MVLQASTGQHPCSEEGDPWRISEEQHEYYTNQFRGLQPDLGALILGEDPPSSPIQTPRCPAPLWTQMVQMGEGGTFSDMV